MVNTFLKQKLNVHWQIELADLLNDEWFNRLSKNVEEAYQNDTIFPNAENIFNALNLLKLNEIKVVIIGQDPYHGIGEANGLCFSVNKGIKIPPSLKNIFKELQTDTQNFKIPNHGDLTYWANQGVLLLNSILTVKENTPASHRKLDWEKFTTQLIQHITKTNKHVVFMLWGNYAQQKEELITNYNDHLILKAAHPSPLGAYKGWFGSMHFSKANNYLLSKNILPINWQIPVPQLSIF